MPIQLSAQGFNIRKAAVGEQDDVYPFRQDIFRCTQQRRIVFKGDPTAMVPQNFPDHRHRTSPIDNPEVSKGALSDRTPPNDSYPR